MRPYDKSAIIIEICFSNSPFPNYAPLPTNKSIESRPSAQKYNKCMKRKHLAFVCEQRSVIRKRAILLKTSDQGCNPCGRLEKQTSGN